jgi:hypothetical protein
LDPPVIMSLRQRLSFEGIFRGAITDLIGTFIWGFFVGLYIGVKNAAYGSHPLQGNVVQTVFSQDPIISILTILVVGGFGVLGGYIAARFAKHDELLNGTLSSSLRIIFALVTIASTPISSSISGIVSGLVFASIGGCLGFWYNHRRFPIVPADSGESVPIGHNHEMRAYTWSWWEILLWAYSTIYVIFLAVAFLISVISWGNNSDSSGGRITVLVLVIMMVPVIAFLIIEGIKHLKKQ